MIKEGTTVKARIGRGAGAEYTAEELFKAFSAGSSVRIYSDEAAAWLKIEAADVGATVEKIFAITFDGADYDVVAGGTFHGCVVPSEEFDALEGVQAFATKNAVYNAYYFKTADGGEI